MSTVLFRYGFHPEGFDPLLALRATQPATAVQGPARTIQQQERTAPSTLVAGPSVPYVPQVLPRRIVRQERSRRGRGWGKFLWASLVLLSAGIGGTVWATGENSSIHGPDAPTIAFAEPTIIEPELLPSDQTAYVATDIAPASVPAVQPPVAHPPSPATPQKPSPAPAAPSTNVPSTPEPSQPSVSHVPPAFPSVTLPPAVVWTPAPAPEKPSPPASTPETPVRRPTVVARPEAKPSLRVPPAAQTRTPVSQPKARPSPITAGKMTRATK